jgi:hypothetical protein
MQQRIVSFLAAGVAALILWFILQRLVVVVFVQMPWWVLLLIILGLFLTIEHFLSKALRGR